MAKGKKEATVGLFVIIGLLILSVFVFFVSGVYFFKKGYTIDAAFGFIANVEQGAPVRLAGVQVGEVSDIKITYEEETHKPKVILSCFILDGVKIRQDAAVDIRGTFALSEPHINITASGKPDGKLLKDGDLIEGNDPVVTEELVKRGKEISYKVEAMVDTIREFVDDPETKESFKKIIKNLGKVMQGMGDFLGESGVSFESAMKNIDESSAELTEILEKINAGKGTAGKLLSDQELYDELLAFAKEIRAHPWKLLKRDEKQFVTEEDKKRGRIFD